jgi:hypothetical protein
MTQTKRIALQPGRNENILCGRSHEVSSGMSFQVDLWCSRVLNKSQRIEKKLGRRPVLHIVDIPSARIVRCPLSTHSRTYDKYTSRTTIRLPDFQTPDSIQFRAFIKCNPTSSLNLICQSEEDHKICMPAPSPELVEHEVLYYPFPAIRRHCYRRC